MPGKSGYRKLEIPDVRLARVIGNLKSRWAILALIRDNPERKFSSRRLDDHGVSARIRRSTDLKIGTKLLRGLVGEELNENVGDFSKNDSTTPRVRFDFNCLN